MIFAFGFFFFTRESLLPWLANRLAEWRQVAGTQAARPFLAIRGRDATGFSQNPTGQSVEATARACGPINGWLHLAIVSPSIPPMAPSLSHSFPFAFSLLPCRLCRSLEPLETLLKPYFVSGECLSVPFLTWIRKVPFVLADCVACRLTVLVSPSSLIGRPIISLRGRLESLDPSACSQSPLHRSDRTAVSCTYSG